MQANPLSFPPEGLAAVVFDMYGTCVDWRGSLVQACAGVGKRLGFDLDWEALADGWRSGYAPAMERIRDGRLPWMNLDALNHLILQDWLKARSIHLGEGACEALNRCWERLAPWPDVLSGLHRLKRRHIIAPLSNGTVATLTGIARFGGLPWDCVLSTEIDRVYKWDAGAYLMAARLLRLPPQRILMVAAHRGDLKAARKLGLRTCFVARPREYGPHLNKDLEGADEFDLHVDSFTALAAALDC